MTRRRDEEGAGTAARILDAAERLVQVRGFNGFSYADIAGELGVAKASLHYHFSGKAELGVALVTRYTARFGAGLAAIDARVTDPAAKLRAFAELYAEVLRGRRMCLCGMLAAEYETLPAPMREAVLRFFDQCEGWLAGVVAEGDGSGQLVLRASPDDTARMIVSTLEGAMLVARSYGDMGRFETATAQLITGLLTVPAAAAPTSSRRRS